ncbi:MAG: efflux RND transporter periplasmic adaptor subunit [Pseudomonadota bacterium]
MNESKKFKKATKIILLLSIVALVVVALVIKQKLSKSDKDNISYRQAQVEKDDLKITILSTGTVGPENRVEIKPPIAGRIEKVLVSEGNIVRKGQLLAWMSSTERAAMLDAASAKGAEEVKKWEEMYRATPILAPINGAIIQRNIESGQTFTISDAILVMSDRLTVKAQVDETDISQIKVKQKAILVLDAYPNQEIAGTVDKIAYDAKTVNNVTTYIVDVLPTETPAFMRSGMTANVTFEINSKPDVLLIPADAIKTRDGKSTVQAATEKGQQSSERQIEVGLSDGKRTEVLSGLAEGEIVFVPEFRSTSKKGSNNSTNPLSPMGGGGRRGH